MKRTAIGIGAILLLIAGVAGIAFGAGGDEQPTEGETLELRVWNDRLAAAETQFANNRDDVVTPYVESKFDFRFEEVMGRNEQRFIERLNQFIATDNLPDYIIADKRNTDQAIATGEFADLTDYIDQMPNLQRWFNEYGEEFWAAYTTDGRIYQIPVIVPNDALPKYREDPYATPGFAWALWAREDILRQAGYAFEPVEDIVHGALAQGTKPAVEDFALDPPVNNPDAFREMLQRIADLGLTVGDAPVVPLSIPSWSQFHLGSIFDFGHWTVKPDGSAGGFLGSVDAETYYKYLWGLQRDGLIDQDWIIQRDEQLQQKVASGRVAVGMYVPDMNSAMAALVSINPAWTIRYIPWPKSNPNEGFFDIRVPGFARIVIRKDFPEIDRLIEYFDWVLGDEGLELMTWGPDDSGLTTTDDSGNRIFTTDALNAYAQRGQSAMADGTGESPTNYGLGFRSRAAIASTGFKMYDRTENPYWYTRSFPPYVDPLDLNKNTVGGTGISYDGRASYGDGGENTTRVIDYYWTNFQNLEVGKLLTPETEEEWNEAWDGIISHYRDIGYEAAEADMEAWFAEYGTGK